MLSRSFSIVYVQKDGYVRKTEPGMDSQAEHSGRQRIHVFVVRQNNPALPFGGFVDRMKKVE